MDGKSIPFTDAGGVDLIRNWTYSARPFWTTSFALASTKFQRHLVDGPFANYNRLVLRCHLCQPQTAPRILPLNQGFRGGRVSSPRSFCSQWQFRRLRRPPSERRAQPEITLGTLLLVELGQDDGHTQQQTLFVCPVSSRFRVSV